MLTSTASPLCPLWRNLEGYDLLLASQSPRRLELLRGIGLDVKQITSCQIDEVYPQDLPLVEVPAYLCRAKADACRSITTERSILITADTVVILDDLILGKPRDREEAYRMLSALSGRRHLVVTAVTLMTPWESDTWSDMAWVEFAHLRPEDIRYYIEHYKPYDKAGAYGIQEWIGYRAISRIEGSFYTVMGLPIQSLSQKLLEIPPRG